MLLYLITVYNMLAIQRTRYHIVAACVKHTKLILYIDGFLVAEAALLYNKMLA
jgi:hypothetical protein